jgi:endoglucanase Acf2
MPAPFWISFSQLWVRFSPTVGGMLALVALCVTPNRAVGQVVPVGSGSYTTTFPGVDAAGRNGYPSGTPFTTGTAATKPVPTNDWWSNKVKNAHSDNLFTYPFTLKTKPSGLVVTYIPWGPIDNIEPVVVGVAGLSASSAKVSDFGDWTVTMDWTSGSKNFTAQAGMGMPFLHFTKASGDVATVQVNQGTVTVSNEVLVIENARNGADFAVYAPAGSVWTQSGSTYSSTLNGKNYWSLAFLPLSAANLSTAAQAWKKYAYVVPVSTQALWSFDEATSAVTTHFQTDVDVKEGPDSLMLQGLLPHQWAHLTPSSPALSSTVFPTVRGMLKCMESNDFWVKNTFYGILPTLPYVDLHSPSFQPGLLDQKVSVLQNDALATWTDSYNEGQEMNRLIQTARIAELTKDSVAFSLLFQTVKDRLEDWLSVQSGEVAFLFYYHAPWSALLGYPAGHGQDLNLNDHHFHWGYFIHAASFVEQFQPGWAAQWGGMVQRLVRDAASHRRDDPWVPYLRNFSPYAGHSWANGFATFPQGNDQESTSESMQFNSALIHWGSVTGNDSIRDLGIYLYTTEQSAVEEYWFDRHQRNFGPNQPYQLVSRVWGNSYDNGTFWTSDIAASYGIELYPIHGGSLYLGHDTAYAASLWAEIGQNTGILSNAPNVNLWHDVMWQYAAFTDPQKALQLYDSYPNRSLKFGVSDAQTYHWLHAMNALGRVNVQVTASHPLAATFVRGSDTTYVAQNYGPDTLAVVFSSGYVLPVPPRTLATSRDPKVSGTLAASYPAAYVGGTVSLTASLTQGTPTQVVFYQGDSAFATLTQPPFVAASLPLPAGVHRFHARLYEGNKVAATNLVEVVVGEQSSYAGAPHPVPGTWESGHYDVFEGGNGNGVAYHDGTAANFGDFRTDEAVDVKAHPAEGKTVGWITPGEWLEFTVQVAQTGLYQFQVRYACGNAQGGGPFRLYRDGYEAVSPQNVVSTGGWNTWSTKTVSGVPLVAGEHVLRLFFEGGEFNVGRITTSYTGPLAVGLPIAQAGPNQLVVLPVQTALLQGGASTGTAAGPLTYRWTQLFGPSNLAFAAPTAAQTSVSGLVAGVYRVELEVSDGVHQDRDDLYLISSATANAAPTVSLVRPRPGVSFLAYDPIDVSAWASDLNDSVVRVDFTVNGQPWLSDVAPPFEGVWQPTAGTYQLQAVAFDSYGDSAVSPIRTVVVDPAPSCFGTSWNGDFSYRFSPADNNPTLTFIPSGPGVGTPTCILYYGTDPGALPGYPVTPNVPFPLNATKGTRLYFYYTYSFPGAVEKNNSAHKNQYVVGSCVNLGMAASEAVLPRLSPNPGGDWVRVEHLQGPSEIQFLTGYGQVVLRAAGTEPEWGLSLAGLPNGLYTVVISDDTGVHTAKFVKAGGSRP